MLKIDLANTGMCYQCSHNSVDGYTHAMWTCRAVHTFWTAVAVDTIVYTKLYQSLCLVMQH